jgi:hypothetical protein
MTSLSHTITSVAEMRLQTRLDEGALPVKAPVAVRRIVNTITSNRTDWRNSRYASTQYASSRVTYVEEKMTAAQLREFD